MTVSIIGGIGESQPTSYGSKPKILIVLGDLIQADFAITGAIGKLVLPVGSVIIHAGPTIVSGAGAAGFIRMNSANDTHADWYTMDDRTAATIVTS